MAVRFGAIELKRPVRAGTGDQAARSRFGSSMSGEVDPPRGVEPLHWRLTDARGRDVGGGAPDHHLVSHALDYRTGVPVVEIALPGHRGFANGGSRWLPQTGCRGADRGGARDATRAGARRNHRPAGHRRGRCSGHGGSETAQRHAGRSHCSSKTRTTTRFSPGLRLDRRRKLGPVIPRADTSARTKDHACTVIQADQILLGWHLANRSADAA